MLLLPIHLGTILGRKRKELNDSFDILHFISEDIDILAIPVAFNVTDHTRTEFRLHSAVLDV